MNKESHFVGSQRLSLRYSSVTLLFVGSGCAALIYEVIWFHLLRLVVGGSAVSMGIVLSTFMGGMCLGSLLAPHLISPRWHPLKVYAGLEIAIGLIGATLPWWMPALHDWYIAQSDATGQDLLIRALVAGGCLLPGTILMGATLPAVARSVASTPAGLADMGFFYGANTLGAVLGCFIAGFLLLPQSDVTYASYVAAAINVLVGLQALSLARRMAYEPAELLKNESKSKPATENVPMLIALVMALSGFTALAAEVVWTRLLSLLFGATTYTFAIILMVFLAGIGIGSAVASKLVVKTNHPLRWLAVCQLLLMLLLVFANLAITRVVPFWPPKADGYFHVYGVFLHDSLRAALAVFPSAIIWGATFSVGLVAASHGQRDAGRLVGQAYAANTLGAILGSVLTTMLLVPSMGSHLTQQLMICLAAITAVLALYAERRKARISAQTPVNERNIKNRESGELDWLAVPRSLWGIGFVAFAAIAMLLPYPHGLLGNSIMPRKWGQFRHVYERESLNTAVVVLEEKATGARSLCVSGKVEASNNVDDLRCQRMLGHICALFHPNPKSTLTVGLGAGTTAGSFVLYPEVEKIRICEIEPAVIEAAGFFAADNDDVVNDPRTEIIIDDARHYMATTKEKFDIISSDSIHPWVRGSAILYSQEYYELCKSRLKPGGIMVQWIPLYQTDFQTVSCELATFLSVFPSATLWSSGSDRRFGYDIIAVAQAEESPIDLEAVQARIDNNPELKSDLAEVDIDSVVKLFEHYVGCGKDLATMLQDAQINREATLKLEYMAGMASYIQEPDAILRLILRPLRYPTELLANDERFYEGIHSVLGLPLPETRN
ncbi:fused MFS/spermidine synthase [Bythopirellula polymerisocia]|uniref:Polyamine aminopropyltransferase n=1 Tax=Bythopirellula polymerisocia TaxID=2528003 RepID=A0A5C6CHE1_9BACT|nr:fused MFS/spermidine synthase [Bythopirellula polymerisocia]TWU23612.1 Spermidine synthase [Bythopirellula polymerisocia]